MYLHLKNRWRPSAVNLGDYADDCEFWRQGVSLHVLRQNISADQKHRVSQSEFHNDADFERFSALNDQKALLCQSSTSSSEVTDQLLRECLLQDPSIASADYLIYCHRSIDLEFYSSPACRAQNALQNHKIIPFSLSQCGTAAGIYGLEMAHVLGRVLQRGIVLALNDIGLMPSRRRVLNDVLVNDGASVIFLANYPSGFSVEFCETSQYSILPECSIDLLPAFVDLLMQASVKIGPLDGMTCILPRYSRAFVECALVNLPIGPSYVFENRDGGYSGVNYVYNALELMVELRTERALILQVSETGAGAFCALRRG